MRESSDRRSRWLGRAPGRGFCRTSNIERRSTVAVESGDGDLYRGKPQAAVRVARRSGQASVSVPFSNENTGIPATPGHYNTSEILGFSAPGISFQLQVAFRPAK